MKVLGACLAIIIAGAIAVGAAMYFRVVPIPDTLLALWQEQRNRSTQLVFTRPTPSPTRG